MSEGYTPGPWSWALGFCELHADDESVVIAADDEFNVEVRNPADAALIAAAPDMYEALINAEQMVKIHTGPDDAIATACLTEIRAALRKAEGAE